MYDPQENDQQTSNNNDGYRSIGEVVGGLHGGKYQFDSPSAGLHDDCSFSGQGLNTPTQNINKDMVDEDLDLPNWAKKMFSSCLSTNTIENPTIVQVPSNSNRLNGIIQYASVCIRNDERTWEHYYANILKYPSTTSYPNGNINKMEPISYSINECPFRITRRHGSLAPRGGASNACDASQPYSDSVNINIIHDETITFVQDSYSWWVVVGTEEEKWFYRLQLQSSA